MKKRLLICHWNMVIGGIETALLNLLKRLDPAQFEIDLLLEEKRGDFLSFIPSYVHVMDSASIGLLHGGTKKAFFHEIKRFRWISALKIVRQWKQGDMHRFDCFYRRIPQLKYDVAISFSMHSIGLMQLVNEYVEAPIKMVFIHNEPIIHRSLPGTVNMDERIKCIGNFTHICGVSADVTEKFKKLFPQYEEKCCVIYNFIDVECLIEKSNEFEASEMKEEGIKILSVGRFTSQKNFTIIPYVCEELVKRNVDFKWYVIGEGEERAVTQEMIERKGLSGRVFLLGAKINPYPYFKSADYYCQPSLSEAYCITLCEARVFEKISIVTSFHGAREQLSDGRGGFIVENDAMSIAEGIIRAINLSSSEREAMMASARYPNAREKESATRLFGIIGQD